MKVVKVLLKVVLGIVALVLLAVLTLPLWLGPVAKPIAGTMVPKFTQTGFHLGHLYLNPYTCRFELADMQLENPAGYPEKYAVTVGDVAFDAKTLSLATDVIHIEEIKIKDIFVSVVSGGPEKVGNFTQIQYNVAGGKEKFEAKKAEAEKKAELAKAEKPAKEETAAESEAEKPAKKIIIDRLEISGLKVQLGFLPIAIPSFTLTDIGKDSGGATLEEAWQSILTSIMKAAGAVGDQLKNLGSATGDAAKQASEAAGKAAKQASEAASKAASQAGEALGNAAGKASDAVGAGAKAAGEAAGKAIDSIKNLW